MHFHQLSAQVFTIEGFWTKSQCEKLITTTELAGFKAAKVETDKGQVLRKDVRNNNRVIFEDRQLADEIWDQLKPFAPQRIGDSMVVGLNELFRCYQYQEGQEFKKHRDQSFIRNETEASYYTFMIYLNDTYEGGETSFNEVTVKPHQGMALIFLHDLEHAGMAVRKGVKYVLRTDIMYRLTDGSDL